MSNFDTIRDFEALIANYFNAPYAVAVDCCTHGLELCLRFEKADSFFTPKHTYLSVPMLGNKLGINHIWKEDKWKEYYYITDNIIDAAVLWRKNSYINGTYMVLSFQFRKHLSLGRGGIILLDNEKTAHELRKMAYDGRDNTSNVPWAEQEISNIGYHYYMTPETAQSGLSKFHDALCTHPKKWSWQNYPDLSKFKIFNDDSI